MGIKKKIKHAIKKKKEKEIAFEVDNHKVIKTEDYICNGETEGEHEKYDNGPAEYIKCSEEGKIKTTVYITDASVRFRGAIIRYKVYVYPVMSGKKKGWVFFLHDKLGNDEDDYSGEENYYGPYSTPREAVEAALDMIASIPYT